MAVEGAHKPRLKDADKASLLRFDPSGALILGKVDGAARVWSATTGDLIAVFN